LRHAKFSLISARHYFVQLQYKTAPAQRTGHGVLNTEPAATILKPAVFTQSGLQ
jgi:hypothetical protein